MVSMMSMMSMMTTMTKHAHIEGFLWDRRTDATRFWTDSAGYFLYGWSCWTQPTSITDICCHAKLSQCQVFHHTMHENNAPTWQFRLGKCSMFVCWRLVKITVSRPWTICRVAHRWMMTMSGSSHRLSSNGLAWWASTCVDVKHVEPIQIVHVYIYI